MTVPPHLFKIKDHMVYSSCIHYFAYITLSISYHYPNHHFETCNVSCALISETVNMQFTSVLAIAFFGLGASTITNKPPSYDGGPVYNGAHMKRECSMSNQNVRVSSSGAPKRRSAVLTGAQDTLPVFRVTPDNTSEARAHGLMNNVFGGVPYSASYNDSLFIARALDNSAYVELDTLSGGVWIVDETLLWNISTRSQNFTSLNPREAAESLIKKHDLLPGLGNPFSVEFSGISSTMARQELTTNPDKHEYKQIEFQLDVSAHYLVKVNLPCVKQPLPVVGGGGNFQLTLGSEGQLIGYHSVWRQVQNSGVEYKVIPQTESDCAFLNSTKELKIVNFNSTLAYYSAPTGELQNYLFPVYVYHATAQFGNQTVPLRDTFQPATEFGMELFEGCITGQKTATSRSPDTTQSRLARGLSKRTKDDNTWEVGTEWLGKPWGLSKTQANANGFTNGLLADSSVSWKNSFDWGDKLVWESDFNSHDDIWVDDVDFLFYTGHANLNGWVTNTPSTTFVDHSIVGNFPETPGDLWGDKDLEWMVIAACGPHQDERIVAGEGSGNAFDRWRGAFDGLHIMLAYATVTADTAEEGKRLVKYAKQGKTLIQSWFKLAKEIQTSGVFVTAMWAETGGNDAGNDHLPGHGHVAGDPVSANGQTRWLMWSKV